MTNQKPLSRLVLLGEPNQKTSFAVLFSAVISGNKKTSTEEIKQKQRNSLIVLARHAVLEVETELRRFELIDFEDQTALLNGVFIQVPAPVDGAVWAATYPKITEHERLQLSLMRELSLPISAVFMGNTTEATETQLDNFALQLREELASKEFFADEIYITPRLEELCPALEQSVSLRPLPTYFVASGFPQNNRLTGHMERGTFQEGETIELLSTSMTREATILQLAQLDTNKPWLKIGITPTEKIESLYWQIASQPGVFSICKEATAIVRDAPFETKDNNLAQTLWPGLIQALVSGKLLHGICYLHPLHIIWTNQGRAPQEREGAMPMRVDVKIIETVKGFPDLFRFRLYFMGPVPLCCKEQISIELTDAGRFFGVIVSLDGR